MNKLLSPVYPSLALLFITVVISIETHAADAPPVTPVSTAMVHSEKLIIELNATGSLVANESLMLKPEINGRIAAIKFREGIRVKTGDVLVTLDANEYHARLDVSKANLKLQKISFDRAERLYKQNLTSSQEYDQAAAQMEEAKATLSLNEEILRKTILRAPFDAILGLRQVSPGDYVKEGTAIVDVTDISTLKVDFQISETAYSNLNIGQKLDLQVDSYPGETFHGEVYVIAPSLDASSRSLKLRARIPNIDQRLRPGMFARIQLHIAELDNALMIPEEALWPIGDKQFVYRVIDDKVAMTEVQVGYRRHGDVQITNGIEVGEQVVTAGQMKIRDGAAVKILNTESGQEL